MIVFMVSLENTKLGSKRLRKMLKLFTWSQKVKVLFAICSNSVTIYNN